MRNMNFDKREFKKQVKENVKLLYRKNFEEANSQEVYQAVALAGDSEGHGGEGSEDRLLYVHGISDGPCPGQQPDQSLRV